MSHALVVSTPSKLEAEKIAGWMSRMVHQVSVHPSNGEWGIFVPPAALHRARAAFRKVIAANPGALYVYVKHGTRPYLRLRRSQRSVRAAATVAHAAVRAGAVKAVVLDRRGKVRFIAFDRRRVAGNPLDQSEARQLIAHARGSLRDSITQQREEMVPNAIATAGYALGKLSAAEFALLGSKGLHRERGKARRLGDYAQRRLNMLVDKEWQALAAARPNPALLLSKEAARSLPPLYSQEKVEDPLARVKFFTPWTYWTWYATEFDGKDTFFGLVQGHEDELGYFSLAELSKIRGPGGLRIERDLYFTPTPLSKLRRSAAPNRRARARRNAESLRDMIARTTLERQLHHGVPAVKWPDWLRERIVKRPEWVASLPAGTRAALARATGSARNAARRNAHRGGNGTAAPYVLVVMGRRIPVRNWSEASNAVSVIRDRSGLGYSEMGAEFPIYSGGRAVAYVSYNGKVWLGKPGSWPKAKLVYDPYRENPMLPPFGISPNKRRRARRSGRTLIRRRAARRNPNGREYVGYAKLEGIHVRVAAEHWADRFGERWKVYAYPTPQGKGTEHYREIRRKLGDDWDFDITNTWAEPGKLPVAMQEKIADITMPGWRAKVNRRRRG